jgi:hypothetical protein
MPAHVLTYALWGPDVVLAVACAAMGYAYFREW